MRSTLSLMAICCFCLPLMSQETASDEALLAKTRALYDAPFTRGLISFDCAIQFDWKQHFVDAQHWLDPTKAVSPAAISAAEHLQTVPHRVFVDRSGAVVSAIPKAPDLTGVAHAPELEQALQTMVEGGLDTWGPFASNIILPIGPPHGPLPATRRPTKYAFEKIDRGYKVTMTGDGLSVTLVLNPELSLISGDAVLPQAYQFTTDFTSGPVGYLLQSISTEYSGGEHAKFDYTYQTVHGVQLPMEVVVSPSTSEPWRYSLSDCKVMKGTVIEIGPPKL
jgi:hypothetical protein